MPVVGRTVRRTFAASPDAVAPVRSEVAQMAAAAGADPARVEEIRLAVSEAITNAIVHGYRGGRGEITVQACAAHGQLWVTVIDGGEGPHAVADCPGLGLGLGLISRLSDDCSILPGGSGGTEVRIRFGLEPVRGDDTGMEPVARTLAA
jgi:anti-sigma regulatory factor (Ser/Thr protein kinase)